MAAPRYGARPVYFTDVVVRHDHPARAFADLRGATWSYNDPGSHSGYNVVRHHLLELGETRGYFGRVVCGGLAPELDPDGPGRRDRRFRHRLHGARDRGRRPPRAGDGAPHDRRPRAEPHSAGRGPARALDPALQARLRALLLGMSEDPDGRAVLAAGRMAGFVPVRDADYDPIRAMARRAEAAGFLTLR